MVKPVAKIYFTVLILRQTYLVSSEKFNVILYQFSLVKSGSFSWYLLCHVANLA
jgi:hypothetical protein